jgi:hypothetical protein
LTRLAALVRCPIRAAPPHAEQGGQAFVVEMDKLGKWLGGEAQGMEKLHGSEQCACGCTAGIGAVRAWGGLTTSWWIGAEIVLTARRAGFVRIRIVARMAIRCTGLLARRDSFRRSGEATLPTLYLDEQFKRPFNFGGDLADILAVHRLVADMPQIEEWRKNVSDQGQR